MARVMGAKPINFDNFCQIFSTVVEPATLKVACPQQKEISSTTKNWDEQILPKNMWNNHLGVHSLTQRVIQFDQQKQKLHPSDGCRYTSPRRNPDHVNDTKKQQKDKHWKKHVHNQKIQNLTIPMSTTQKKNVLNWKNIHLSCELCPPCHLEVGYQIGPGASTSGFCLAWNHKVKSIMFFNTERWWPEIMKYFFSYWV